MLSKNESLKGSTFAAYSIHRSEKEYHKPQRLELMTQQHMLGSLLLDSSFSYLPEVQRSNKNANSGNVQILTQLMKLGIMY